MKSSCLKYTFLHFISPCHTNQLTILSKTTPKSSPVFSAAVLVKTHTIFSQFELQLWRNSHVFFLSHFETQTSSLYDKNALYYFLISLFVPEISQSLKYANNSSDDGINLTEYELKSLILAERVYCVYSTIWLYQFCYHGNICLFDYI